MLGVAPSTVRDYASRGLLAAIVTSGVQGGRGKRMYFDPGEVKAMNAGGFRAAEEYRQNGGASVDG